MFDTDYNPISQVASDYGVGRFAIEMNLGFLVGGIGLVAFASASIAVRKMRRISIVGSSLLIIDGLVLAMDSFLHTDLEGAPHTPHGIIHSFGGAIFFFTVPVALLLVTYRFGRRRFLLTLAAFLLCLIFEIASSVTSLNTGGLGERVILLVIFVSVIATSLGYLSGLRRLRP